jgi:hypothetical protein
MVSIRRWHSYIGLFIAPSVLFFALTGAVQLFSLHEAHGSYQPPVLLEKLSSIHKDQVFELGHHHDDDGPAPGPEDHDDKPGPATFILKGYFLLVALGLAVSTVFGLWMGLVQTRSKTVGWLLVGVGSVIPLVLLLI